MSPKREAKDLLDDNKKQLGGGLPPGFSIAEKKGAAGGQLGGTGLHSFKCKEFGHVAKDCPNK